MFIVDTAFIFISGLFLSVETVVLLMYFKSYMLNFKKKTKIRKFKTSRSKAPGTSCYFP